MSTPNPAANPEAFAYLETRRSAPAKLFTDPVPAAAELDRIMTAALRVPDHGKLEPWWLVVLHGNDFFRLADLPESRARELGGDAEKIAKGRERLKAHMRNMHVFDPTTLRAKGGIDKESGYKLDGDYFGLPWPCFGTAESKHPGTHLLYNNSLHVMDGGGNFRANFGVEREGQSLLAGDGSHSKGAEITTGYPEFDHVLLKKLGWWADLTDAEKAKAEGKNWKTDLSGGIQRVPMAHGCHPFGNAKARSVVWNFPDPIPKHREPIYSPRPELVAKYPTHDDKKAFWRLPTLFKTVQEKNKDIGNKFQKFAPFSLWCAIRDGSSSLKFSPTP